MVIEDDNRIIIEDWENYKSIVHLKTDLNDELVNCTGTIISKNIILTAAHCVYNQKLNIKAKSAKIFFRQDNVSNGVKILNNNVLKIPKING
ncbi:trypsin-like serine protease [Macrococcus bovicus]|uniref:Trypsin-like serine protease n=1 Tax=Macrococcus bovicus TaxID=69968 RepID=A0A4R6BWB0_9STAP|nr:trypsin-like serine protease [Macrococcus bovicus]TDM12639.1 trypsin-like serine protease [Macrococcus bovicus]